jgi:hypothetical protein
MDGTVDWPNAEDLPWHEDEDEADSQGEDALRKRGPKAWTGRKSMRGRPVIGPWLPPATPGVR